MGFLVGMFVIGLACLMITYKTLAGYSDFPVWAKAVIFLLLFIAWFSPVLLRLLRHYSWVDGMLYAILAKSAYFLMGFAFILIMLLVARDVIWYIIYYVSHKAESLSPTNVHLINRNNLITIFLALAVSVYAFYEANKTPAVREITISDNKIKQDIKLVVASDLHIDRATPLWQIKQIVEAINAQHPDYILLVGDVIDDEPDNLDAKMAELEKLKAQKVFLSFGNHEYYNAPIKWMIKFTHMGFEVLHNTGVVLGDSGVYLAGIPDAGVTTVNYQKALYSAQEDQYKILMSHTPRTIGDLPEGQFNLQVSGHTHGGQIFPFSFLAEAANGYLAGTYEVNGTTLYVTRGAGYWGPPMRLLAPSDITVFNLKAEKNG